MNPKDLERAYAQASIGSCHPDAALFRIPGLGCIELMRGQPIVVNGREGTLVEWHMIKGWLAQRKVLHATPSPQARDGEMLTTENLPTTNKTIRRGPLRNAPSA